MLALSQVAAVVLAVALINDYGYFYTSWSELIGSSPTVATLTHVVPRPVDRWANTARGVITTRRATPIGPDIGWSTRAEWPTRGRVQTVTILGPKSHLASQALVYLPPQYYQPRYAHTRFPVAEVLAGYPGSPLELVYRLNLPDVQLKEVTAHRARPMVMVMLSPSVVLPRDTECTDVPGGPQAETYLAQDLPAVVGSIYRVRPSGWAVMGQSTGGYCAVKIAMDHTRLFSTAVSLSGYTHTVRDKTTGDLWGGSSVLRDHNDPEWRLAHEPAPPLSLLLTISKDEQGPEGYADTQKFISLVQNPLMVDLITLQHGGHNFATVAAVVPRALDWVSTHLSKQCLHASTSNACRDVSTSPKLRPL